jgi:hypothetical protein
MKKLYSQSKQRKFARKKQIKALEKIRHRKKVIKVLNIAKRAYQKLSRTQRRGFQPYRKRKVLSAPDNFSFINNTEKLIIFFNEMEKIFNSKCDVFVDFSNIKYLTPDSLVVFISKIKDRQFNNGMNCSGNEPEDKELRQKFVQSGFYDIVISRSLNRQQPTGSFRQKKSKSVEAEMADDLITFVTMKLYKEYRKCGGVTNALLESMGNTRGHAAAGRKNHFETWWVAAQCDIKEKKAYYSFVDNGVGIFKSKQPSVLQQTLNILRIKSNAELLMKMLRRQIPSSTGIAYRGRGLPSIFKSMKRGDIANLIIISNDVYANVAQDDYRRLSPPFNGTFLYWEYPGENYDQNKIKSTK